MIKSSYRNKTSLPAISFTQELETLQDIAENVNLPRGDLDSDELPGETELH